MKTKTYLVLVNGSTAIKRFRTMAKCYSYLLWYNDRVASHFAYVIYSGKGIVIEKDQL